MKPTLARELALDALLMAVWRRRPKQPLVGVTLKSTPIMSAYNGTNVGDIPAKGLTSLSGYVAWPRRADKRQ
jgi:hypothetical protein